MGLAIGVEGGGLRVPPEADRPVLVGDAGERDALAEKEIPREETLMALVTVDRTPGLPPHRALERGDEAEMSLLVVRPVGQYDVTVAIERHPVVGIGQVLRRQPEVE